MAAVATICSGSNDSGINSSSSSCSNSVNCNIDSTAHDERDDVILEPLKFLKNSLPAPLESGPMLLPSDSTSSPLKSTRLAGQLISCFVVGGECRLCLPQLLAMILPNISDSIIQKVYTELQIHTAVATLLQMESLKISGILPPGTSSCSLIRKSDAERLVSRLLPQSSGRLKNPKLRENAVSVCHDDFGGCNGLLIPALITADEYCAAIECTECKLLFTGETFVSHTHQNTFTTAATNSHQQICHWGFDTANWRYYIYLANESVDSAEDDLKQLQLFTNYKQIEAQNRLTALVNSQMQQALKRHADTKLDGFSSDTCFATKMSKLLPGSDAVIANVHTSVDNPKKLSQPVLAPAAAVTPSSASAATAAVTASVSSQPTVPSTLAQPQSINTVANPTALGHDAQLSLQTLQNLQLILNLQNSQTSLTQMSLLTLQQQLAKLASLPTIPTALLLQQPAPSYDSLKELSNPVNPTVIPAAAATASAAGISSVARSMNTIAPTNTVTIPTLTSMETHSSSISVPVPVPVAAPAATSTSIAKPSSNLSEASSSELNIINKLLTDDVRTVGLSGSTQLELSRSCSGVVGSLDELLESNMSVNAYALARTMLNEERTRQQQKMQRLEAEVEQLQMLVEQLRRGQILYQNLLISGNVTGIRDIYNMGAKTAIF